jgi:3-phenylpropionate/cinnamic acid dioxygenase small subunit
VVHDVSVDDHQAIAEVIARYAVTLDEGDADGWAECFTEDGRYTLTLPEAEAPAFDIRGRRALAEYRRANPIIGVGAAWQHVVSNLRIAVDASLHTAEARSYWTSIAADPRPEILAFGVYHDRLARQADGSWLLAERVNQTRATGPRR